MRRLAALGLLALAGCSEELAPPGRMTLTSGHEPDPWSVSPAPVEARLRKHSAQGDVTELGTAKVPLASFSLGRGGAGSYDVEGVDAAGVARVHARSLLIDPAGFAGGTLPLFVARAGELARPPGELESDVGVSPVAASVAARHLLLAREAGGLALDGYDLAAWRPIAPPPPLDCGAPSCVPRSLAVVQGSLVLAMGEGWGFWFDPIVGDHGGIDPPDGLKSFGDVAGGRAVAAPDGSVYVVGGTRASSPSSAVLAIAADGALSHLSLVAPRQGAAAAWVEGRGLVVVGGGSATAAGGELLGEGAKSFVPLALAPDESRGSALVVLETDKLLRVGGRLGSTAAPSVELDLGCAASCSPAPGGDAVDVAPASAFSAEGGAVIAGDDPSGETRAFRFVAGKPSELPLREPRRGATPILLPTGHVGLAGGELTSGGPARTLELYLD